MQGVTYEPTYLDPAVAREKEIAARHAGDEGTELLFSLLGVFASGHAIAGEPLSIDEFDFKPEPPRETFKKLFAQE